MSSKKPNWPFALPLATVGTMILRWTTPQRQLSNLVHNPGKDHVEWENFRDNKCRKWVTLNVTV